jgi:fermentation-respiration switch protein FrsA (DUF1100 family)
LENDQCEDRNKNGVIDTSTGVDDLRAWANDTGTRGVGTAEDECIVHFTRVRSWGTRHVSINKDNDVWVSGTGTREWDLVKGGRWSIDGSGTIIREHNSFGIYGWAGYGGYGGLMDKDGVIWSARNLIRWNPDLPDNSSTTPPNPILYNHDSYGLCVDGDGNVWNTGEATIDNITLHVFFSSILLQA